MKLPSLSEMSARERLLAAGVVFAASIMLLDRVVIGPWLRHVNRVRSDILRLESSLRTYQRLIDRRDQITAEVKAYSEFLVENEDEGETKDTATLIREIESYGKQSGISVSEVRPMPPGPGGEAGFEVHYTGTFKQWVHFAYLVQNSKTFFQVDRSTLGLTAGGELLSGSMRVSRKTALRSQEGA